MRSSSHAGNGQDLSVNTKNGQSDSPPCPGGNTLYIVGTGPGKADHMSGHVCALIFGGDAGIYAMAGLVLEMPALKYLLNFINILIL